MRPFRFFFLVLVLFPIASFTAESIEFFDRRGICVRGKPEMDRLARALVGDWDTVERMDPVHSFLKAAPQGECARQTGCRWIYI